jgi:hypothetical protein
LKTPIEGQMHNPLLLGLLLMMSGAALAYCGLPNRYGQSPFFMTRSGLALIYPAIIAVLLAGGASQIVAAVVAR